MHQCVIDANATRSGIFDEKLLHLRIRGKHVQNEWQLTDNKNQNSFYPF